MIWQSTVGFDAANAVYIGFGGIVPQNYSSLAALPVAPETPSVAAIFIPPRDLTFVERLELRLGEEELIGTTIDRTVEDHSVGVGGRLVSGLTRRLLEEASDDTLTTHSTGKSTGRSLGLSRRLGQA